MANLAELTRKGLVRKKSTRTKTVLDKKAKEFLSAYIRQRQLVQSRYSPHKSQFPHARRAKESLEALGIPRLIWPLYIAWCFRKFNDMNGLAFMPLNVLASEAWMTRFWEDKAWEVTAGDGHIPFEAGYLEEKIEAAGFTVSNYYLPILGDLIRRGVTSGNRPPQEVYERDGQCVGYRRVLEALFEIKRRGRPRKGR